MRNLHSNPPTGRRHTRRCVILHILLAGLLSGGAAAQPTVRFTSSQYHVAEASADALVPLVISETPQMQILVYIYIEAGTADAGWDFVSGSALAYFHAGGADTAWVHVQIYDDGTPEGPETIRLDIAEGNPLIEIGTPGLATLTIVDNDSGTPTAHFEIAEDIPLDQWGRLAILSEPGASRDLEVVVDALPPGGAAIHYTSTADGQIHTLLFTDQPRQTIQVTAPAVTPGHAQAIDELQILNPPTSKSTRSGGVANCSVLLEQLPQEVRDCLACVGFYFMAIIGNYDCQDLANACNFDPVYHCPPLAAAEVSAQRPRSPGSLDAPAALEILRRYRDEILVGAQGGDYYIQLYREQSPLIGAAILQRPTLIHSFAETWDLWLPAITAQVDGQGSSFVITGEMQGALLGIMTEFAEVGGPDLASLMADFREALDLENIAGFTADDLQQRIESNEMNEERATWGEVKSMFRDATR